jgi:hypothetical protein
MAAHLKSDQRRVYLFKRTAKTLSHGAGEVYRVGESSRAQATWGVERARRWMKKLHKLTTERAGGSLSCNLPTL